MSTIKLFITKDSEVSELNTLSVGVEKSLQTLIERNLELFLKVRFLATEYNTGKTHGGRIDTLGIDENNAPVIIEYKQSINANVINQGLFYLDWLLDHKAEFKLLVMGKLGEKVGNSIEWSNARLLCIASNFTKYDEHAVNHMNHNIDLIRYRKFEEGILLFELVNTTSADGAGITSGRQATVTELYEKMSQKEKDRYESIKAFILDLGDDVQEKITKFYIAFKKLSNFACFEFHPGSQEIVIFLKLDPKTVQLEAGFTRDVSKIGHFGTGDLEVKINSDDDMLKAQVLIMRAYEES